MTATSQELELYGDKATILSQDDDCTVYRIKNDDGDVVVTSFSVFPGIHLCYVDAHTQRCAMKKTKVVDILEINHCREGRIECEYKDLFYYLSQGDLSITRMGNTEHDSYFPGGHYHGVSVMIDMTRAPDCLSCVLDEVNVKPAVLAAKFCKREGCYVMRAKAELEHVFSELYSVPESIRKGYFKVKVLEILLFLSSIDITAEASTRSGVPKSQVVLAKQVCRHLAEHMDSRFTTEQLAAHFQVSTTQIKNSVKSVYGTSVYSFSRIQKMREAALLLRRTDETIINLAGRFGYDNGSKFAKAFRDVIGVSPTEYRNLDGSPYQGRNHKD